MKKFKAILLLLLGVFVIVAFIGLVLFLNNLSIMGEYLKFLVNLLILIVGIIIGNYLIAIGMDKLS